jgi:hypothetical protein
MDSGRVARKTDLVEHLAVGFAVGKLCKPPIRLTQHTFSNP